MAKKNSDGGIVGAFDNLPWIVKLIFAFPVLDGLLWGIYRLIKGVKKGSILLILAGLLWIFVGAAILWIVDIICVILFKRPTILA